MFYIVNPMGIKNRDYFVTIYPDGSVEQFEGICDWLDENAIAWTMGEEVGEKELKYHVQGLIQFEHPRSFAEVSKRLYNCNMRKPKSIREVEKYCKKGACVRDMGEMGEGDFERFVKVMGREPMCYENGEYNYKEKQGKRSDLEMVHEMVNDGANMREIICESSNYQCIRTAEKCLDYFEKARDFRPEVYWFWGETGTGKSRTAHELASEEFGEDVYETNDNGKWWNGYDGHKCVIIDDFRYDWISFKGLLKLTDRYGYRVETKGGMRQLLAKKIYITCPHTPSGEYKYATTENLTQLERRITEIRKFGSGTEVVAQKSGGNTRHPRLTPRFDEVDSDEDFYDETF